jgi:hypothetical protein
VAFLVAWSSAPRPKRAIAGAHRRDRRVQASQSPDWLSRIAQEIARTFGIDIDPALALNLPALMALLDIPVEDASWSALDALQRRQRARCWR